MEFLSCHVSGKKGPSIWLIAAIVLPLLAACFFLRFSLGMYLSMDETDMRLLLEGSLQNGKFGASGFCPYLNAVYTMSLAWLYHLFPRGPWYDAVNYSFLLFSVVFLAIELRGKAADGWGRAIPIIVTCALAALYFSFPQFTMTAGLLSIVGTLAALHYATADRNESGRWAWLLISVGAFFVASLFRYKCMLVVTVFLVAGMLTLGLIGVRHIKRMLLVILIAFVPIFGAKQVHRMVVNSHEEWREMAEFNQIRARLTDYADVWNTWPDGFEQCLDVANEQIPGAVFSREDYGLLICGAMLGNDDVFGLPNMRKVDSALGKRVHNWSCSRLRFKIIDWCHLFWPLIVFALFAATGAGDCFWLRRCLPFCGFVALICCLRYLFKDPPERLWFNFVVAIWVMFSLRSAQKTGLEKEGETSRLLKIVSVVGMSLSFVWLGHRVLYKQINREYLPYAALVAADLPKNQLQFLSTDCARYLHAFGRNKFSDHHLVILGPLGRAPQYRTYLKDFDLSSEHIWREACQKASPIRFIQIERRSKAYLLATLRTIARFVRKKYGMKVVVVKENIGRGNDVASIRLRGISPAEERARLDFDREYANLPFVEQRVSAVEAARRFLGPHAPASDVKECAEMMLAPILDESFEYERCRPL